MREGAERRVRRRSLFSPAAPPPSLSGGQLCDAIKVLSARSGTPQGAHHLGGNACTHLVGEVEAGLGIADRHDDRQVSILAGDVERRVSVAVLLIHVAAVSEEAADHLHLTATHSQVESSVAFLHTQTHKVVSVCDLHRWRLNRRSLFYSVA